MKDANGINLKRGRLVSNQVLLVPGASGAKLENTAFTEIKTESLSSSRVYSVRKGDTLTSIAKRHGVKAAQIKAWNNLQSNRLAHNQKLNVGPVEKTTLSDVAVSVKVATKASQRVSAKKAPVNKQYTVRRGDTLYSIAQRFAVELDDLLRWNKLSSRKRIQPGDKVTIVLATNS